MIGIKAHNTKPIQENTRKIEENEHEKNMLFCHSNTVNGTP